MSASAMVLVCALDLLGRSATKFPPIKIVETPPTGVSRNAQAFVDREEGAIYLVASAPPFREAAAAETTTVDRGRCAARLALKMVASVIIHEEWHLNHGPDEESAYLAQLTALEQLGLGPSTWPVRNVRRSMLSVLKAR